MYCMKLFQIKSFICILLHSVCKSFFNLLDFSMKSKKLTNTFKLIHRM